MPGGVNQRDDLIPSKGGGMAINLGTILTVLGISILLAGAFLGQFKIGPLLVSTGSGAWLLGLVLLALPETRTNKTRGKL